MKYKPANDASRKIRRFAVLCVVVWLFILPSCKKDDDHPDEQKAVDIKEIASGFVSPIQLVASPDDTKRLFVIDQVGKIWIIDKDNNTLPTPFLDVSSTLVPLNPGFDERGLLGLAFHPDYKNNRRFFIYYQLQPRSGGPASGVLWNNLSRISEFTTSGDPNLANTGSEKVLLEWDDPQFNHNGGTLAFGPDGFLYISVGDGGSSNDTAVGHVEDWYVANKGGNGQDVEADLLGNVLRIDVNTGTPYGIPSDNPFANKTGRDEIYAYGFRNPYRFSFDMGGSHQLILGDAGQLLWEEIDVVTKGGNYGWNVKEGRHCFDAANSLSIPASCPAADNLGNPLIDPVIEINNWQNPSGGRATTVIGGHVYRGQDIEGWDGKYIFGTFSQTPTTTDGELFSAMPAGNSWTYQEVSLKSHPDDIGYYLRGFGQDNAGEIYLTVSSSIGPQGTTGKVFKLVQVPGN
ncbi:PQQ-dependent sugar dehydrogenase [Paraflavitalea sp. CAU 1676]|uniref:PQQ-dependent sugar dehydrogenase n=1 Tax=Paraflavitalea sp. CAU 1676 TaxID=3032598 RepID=UPI0023DB4B1D|nr:PQQ-dependent sugar dehydrogenase [Paraflavitalea sp. CAU 1676]MDF2191414.1 PQQ-dependent sugar dehydrogenase [Paraflavitalea sp. CAU 1676]